MPSVLGSWIAGRDRGRGDETNEDEEREAFDSEVKCF